MRNEFVKPQLVLTAVILAAAVPSLVAQQAPAATQKTDAVVSDATRNQVEGFENSLRGAINSAAGKLNQRVREAFPGMQFTLRFKAQPAVDGVILPDFGAIFHVLIPGVEDVEWKLLMLNARPAPPP